MSNSKQSFTDKANQVREERKRQELQHQQQELQRQ